MDILLVLLILGSIVMMQVFVVIFLVFLLRKRQVWPLIMAAIKGHGTLMCRSHSNRTIEFDYTTSPVDFVKWKVRDKITGKMEELTTNIDKIFHTLKGTGIGVHFCPITYPTNIDLNTQAKSKLGVKKINSLVIQSYLQGRQDESNFGKLGGLNIEHIQIILMVVMIMLIAVNGWLTYNVLANVGAAVV